MPKTAIRTKTKIINKAFAKEFVTGRKSGKPFNSKQAYKALRPEVTEKTAEVLGSRTLSRVEVRKDIAVIMEETGFDRAFRLKILKRNVKQRKSYASSNQAIEIAEKIEADYYNKEANRAGELPVINIGFIQKSQERVEESQ